MEPKDIISLVALALSLLSLIMSVQVYRYNKWVKSIEMRSQLLTSVLNVSFSLDMFRAHYAQVRTDALDKKDIETVRQLTDGRYEERLQRLVDKTKEIAEVLRTVGLEVLPQMFDKTNAQISNLVFQLEDWTKEIDNKKKVRLE